MKMLIIVSIKKYQLRTITNINLFLIHQNLQERITKLISQGYTSYNNRVISENSNSIYLYNSKLHMSIDISACNDEWFKIKLIDSNLQRVYYLCDQFEGLEKMMIDLKFIK